MEVRTHLRLLFRISAKIGKCDKLLADIIKGVELFNENNMRYYNDVYMMVSAIEEGAHISVIEYLKKATPDYKKYRASVHLLPLYGISFTLQTKLYEYVNMLYHTRHSRRDYYRAVAKLLGYDIVLSEYMRQVLVDDTLERAFDVIWDYPGTTMILSGDYVI